MIKSNSEAISFYVPYLSFKTETQVIINSKMILPKIRNFFESRGIKEYSNIQSNLEIAADIDFKSIPFYYFYKEVFNDIGKDQQTRKIKTNVKYIVSYDKSCANQYCDDTKMWFDTIYLNKKPVLYFLFFDINEIIDFVKKETNFYYKKPEYK